MAIGPSGRAELIALPGAHGAYARFWEEAFNRRELDTLDAITAPEFVNHNALPGTPPGPEGHRQVVERLWKAFRDAQCEIEHLASDATR
jgi:hypothetical protein